MPKPACRVARRRACEAGEGCGAFGLDYWEIPVEDAAWLRDEVAGLARQEDGDGEGHARDLGDDKVNQEDQNSY
ncbi:MAG: hypothetical protein IT456_04885 [Planctomycetes bacterium]|nr:hypothetical protein [Planctomycetota bacterium]